MTTRATEVSEEDCVEEVLVSDEENYYVEEIMDDEEEQWDEGDREEELEEETAVEQSYVEEDDDDDDDDGEEEDYVSEESYFDDSSSAPSFCPENPLFENEMDSGMNLHESLSSIDLIREHNLERQRAAVYEGERKAMEEAVARDAYVKRQAAREALQRRRLEQEALASHGDENGYNEADETPLDQSADSAVRILLERIQRTEQILLQENGSVPPRIRVLGAAEQEQRKRALAELRRQTARNQLMDNNSRLKECKAQEFGDSASSVLS